MRVLDAAPPRIPVMTFHSVGDEPLPFDLRHLTTTPALFERILEWLNRREFHSLTLRQLSDHLRLGEPVPRRSVVLAFDDGYLDNWVFVHPLLERHGHRGVIFVSGEFVQDDDSMRPTLHDVWEGGVARSELKSLGYCSWAELRSMSAAGTLEVQSHLMTHTWYPVSDEIVGFNNPLAPSYQEFWNAAPARKPFWLDAPRDELASVVPWGAPIFASARSHLAPRCTPDPHLTEALADYVTDRGGEAFFERPDWEIELRGVASDLVTAPPVYESAAEYLERLDWECAESRRVIEEHLPDRSVDFTAWPGGDWTETAQEVALRHYEATLTTGSTVTVRGEDPSLIKRSFFAQRSFEVMGSDLPSLVHFIGRLQRHRGHWPYAAHTFVANRVMEIGARLRGRTP